MSKVEDDWEHRIGDIIEDFLKYIAKPSSYSDSRCNNSTADQDPDTTSASDRRLRELKDYIICLETAERMMKCLRVVIRISKRVALAEMISRYLEERDARAAMLRNRRKLELPRSSPKDRFTDLLFPDTCKTYGFGDLKNDARKKAKEKLSYWSSLGEPLAQMTQRFGYGFLALLPMKLTDNE